MVRNGRSPANDTRYRSQARSDGLLRDRWHCRGADVSGGQTRLLNTVNTEYQKRVIDRLHKLSEDMYAEYDPSSEHYWPKHDVIGDAVRHIDETFEAHKQQMCEWGEYLGGISVHNQKTRLQVILEALLSDPFVPPRIRLAAVDLLEKRLSVAGSVMLSELEGYGHRLARREIEPGARDVAAA